LGDAKGRNTDLKKEGKKSGKRREGRREDRQMERREWIFGFYEML
jgi:hypothetical protein